MLPMLVVAVALSSAAPLPSADAGATPDETPASVPDSEVHWLSPSIAVIDGIWELSHGFD